MNGIDWEHILNYSIWSNIIGSNSFRRLSIKFDSVIYLIGLNTLNSDLILSVWISEIFLDHILLNQFLLNGIDWKHSLNVLIWSNIMRSNSFWSCSITIDSVFYWIGLNWVGSDSIQFYSIGSYLIHLIQILSDYILLNGIDWEHILNDSMRSNIMRLNSSGRWSIKIDSVIYRIGLKRINSDLILLAWIWSNIISAFFFESDSIALNRLGSFYKWFNMIEQYEGKFI